MTKSTNDLENVFQAMKYLYRSYSPEHNDYLYWRNNGLFECDSFQEVLDEGILEKNRLIYF
jgi:hypothetical protein